MKKILSIMSFACLLVCSGHVFAYENGPKKAVNSDLSFNQVAPDYTVTSEEVFVLNNTESELMFFCEIKNDLFTKNGINFYYSTGCDGNDSLNLHYAIIPDILYIDDLKNIYSIVKATPLPKHYLLPPKNIFWLSGNDLITC